CPTCWYSGDLDRRADIDPAVIPPPEDVHAAKLIGHRHLGHPWGRQQLDQRVIGTYLGVTVVELDNAGLEDRRPADTHTYLPCGSSHGPLPWASLDTLTPSSRRNRTASRPS